MNLCSAGFYCTCVVCLIFGVDGDLQVALCIFMF